MKVARIVLFAALASLPLFGGAAADEAEAPKEGRILRIGVAIRGGLHSYVTPLVYWGGFQTKTAVYDGLTRYGPKGELLPGLAERWEVSPDGRTYVLHLRKGVRFHDGKPLDAETVRNHLMRWRGNFANSWIGSTLRFDEIEAVDASTVRVVLTTPWPFLEECASAINPAFIVGKGAYTHEGAFAKAVGTGPFRVERAGPDGALDLRANPDWWEGKPGVDRVEMIPLPAGHRESKEIAALLTSGRLDVVADGSSPLVPREELMSLAAAGFRIHRSPGTAVTYLVLDTAAGPFADVENRRVLAAAIDRAAYVRDGELGYASPATTLFAPGRAGWPEAGRSAPPAKPRAAGVAFRIAVGENPSARRLRHAETLAEQARAAGFRPEVVREAKGDATFGDTYGAPYDPWVTLQTTFLDRPPGETASSGAPKWRDETVQKTILAGFESPDPAARVEAFRKIQARLDSEAPLIPLFISDRVAVSTAVVDALPMTGDGYDLNLGRARIGELPVRASHFAAPGAGASADAAAGPKPAKTPSEGEVVLPASGGFEASLVLDNKGVGVWGLGAAPFFPHLAAPEVIGLDDKGVLHVLVPYSGRWGDTAVIHDGTWLNGYVHSDLDPRIPGKELYTGSQMGNVYQVVGYRHRKVDYRLIAFLRGYEANYFTAADFDPKSPGEELLVFTNPPAVVMLTPTGPGGAFETRDLGEIDGLVREAVLLPGKPGERPRAACVSRAGWLRILTVGPEGLEWEEIARADSGRGRIAMRPAKEGKELVLYTCLDDGRVERHQIGDGGEWRTETIYLGPLGPRGVAAGRFDDDPATETLAVYGYSGEVELLTRRNGEWSVATIFTDTDKGHSLGTAELDGRNATDELLASGYGGRIVLLGRPAGYGRTELARPSRPPAR